MPSSHFHLIPTIIATLGRYPLKRFLDIGCGSGKYGVLIREYISKDIDAIDVHLDYINDIHYAAYKCVYVMNAMDFDYVNNKYDIYLLLNIIDHFTREDAIKLMEMIPGDMLIAVPQTFYQDDHPDIWEKHKSFWKKEDFDELFGSRFRVEHIPNPYEGQLTDNMILIQKGNASLTWDGEKWV